MRAEYISDKRMTNKDLCKLENDAKDRNEFEEVIITFFNILECDCE